MAVLSPSPVMPPSPPPSSPPPPPLIADSAAERAAEESSIDFGSRQTLDQIRNLTDVAAMTRLLHECIAYQRSLDLNLESLHAQRADHDRQLITLHRSSHHLLSSVRSDAAHLLSSVRSTCELADRVSSKVRELDLAQSNVQATLSRIDAVVERGHCLEGARRALDAEDYESAAGFVRTFLQIDARYRDPGSDQLDQMMEIKRQLESVVRRRLSLAIDQRDKPGILLFLRTFPPLGLQQEGLQVYVAYLRKEIALRSRLDFERLVELSAQQSKGNHAEESAFVECLMQLFKDIVEAVEEKDMDEKDKVLRSLCGDDGIVYAICELQEECDSRGTQILKRYMEHRNLQRLAAEINSYSKNMLPPAASDGPDPREVERYVEEILNLTQLGEDYVEFMLSKIRGLGSADQELGPRASKAFRSGSFSRMLQELTGFYVVLEEFFMVENVRKAIRIDEHVPDSLTTSLVDDVFYVLQSCCHRAISTVNINSVFPILSCAMNLLGNEYHDALQQKMREQNLSAKLFVAGPAAQKTAAEFAAALNDADVSTEYVLKLRQEIEEKCAQVFPGHGDQEKVKACMAEWGEISKSLKQAVSGGLEQLAGTLTPRIRPVLDSVGTVSYELTEAEYEEYEVNDPWVQKLLHAVQTQVAWLQPLLTTANYDGCVHLVVDFVVKRLEVLMVHKRFSPLGGLRLDRDVRALVNHFQAMAQRPVRDKFARLTQITTILNVESVSEILDFWGDNSGTMTWRLTPAEVRRVLSLRVDFKPEAISALRL
ncbi:conserved oligomeric Golgi complex subunit 4 [Wolffia australiana]